MTSRRRLLLGGLGSGVLAGCSGLLTRTPFTLAPVHVAADRVIRVIAGLRPYRASGYVVRMEALGGKRLVHNYGHGGGGITISWGTSHEAVEMGFDGAARPYAVLGCGVVGLSTATLLQRRGAKVTIYAKSLPPDTTSNIAGGYWSPYSVFEPRTAAPEFLARFHRAVRLSYREFQAMAGPRHGISWRRSFYLSDDLQPFGPMQESLRDVLPRMAILRPGEHPFGSAYLQQTMNMMIEPGPYLRSLMDTFLLSGGRIEVRDLASREEVAALPEGTVFNCTGLGAKALFGDDELTPAKGQLVFLLPQPEVDYNLLADGRYMFPRSDGILLGGSFERGNWDATPDAAVTARILERNAAVMARLQA